MKKLKENVLKTIILLTVVSSTLPFFCHDVCADSVTSANIIGVNRTLVNTSFIESHTVNINPLGDIVIARYSYEYEITVQLDDYYLGYINGSFSTSMTDVNYSDGSFYNRTATKGNSSYYVNGNSFTTSFSTIACFRVIQGSNNDPTGTYNTTFTLNTSNVTKYQDLNSIDTVINILNDIYSYVSIDQYTELTNIVNELGLSNTYLENISKYRQWSVPFESLSANIYVLSYVGEPGYYIYDFLNYQYFNLPIYRIDSGKNVTNYNVAYRDYMPNHSLTYIFGIINNPINSTNVYSVLNIDSNLTVDSIEYLESYYYKNNGYGTSISFYKLVITNNTNGNIFLNVSFNNVTLYIPVYLRPTTNKNISTDFALTWGLTNNLLDNLNIIAQGTQQSNTSSSELEDNSSDFNDVADDVYNLENSFNTGLNNYLQQIDTSFDVGNTFGSKFLLAADWVRVQFNTITAENPFGTMLSFSLLLGVALLIIGKVLG